MLLCLQFSNCLWRAWGSGIAKASEISIVGTTNEDKPCKANATEFIQHKWIVSPIIPIVWAKICILSNYQLREIREPPAKYSNSLSQTRINIEISEFLVKSINKESVEISFYYKVDWVDERLQVLQFEQFKDHPFPLDEDQQKSIWIPHLRLETEEISWEKKVDHVTAGIRGNFTPNSPIDVGSEGWATSGAWVEQGIYVMTEVACVLDFKRFPFDHHVCSIKVRIFSNTFNQKRGVYLYRHPLANNMSMAVVRPHKAKLP